MIADIALARNALTCRHVGRDSRQLTSEVREIEELAEIRAATAPTPRLAKKHANTLRNAFAAARFMCVGIDAIADADIPGNLGNVLPPATP